MKDRVDNRNSLISFLEGEVFQDLQLSFGEQHIDLDRALSRRRNKWMICKVTEDNDMDPWQNGLFFPKKLHVCSFRWRPLDCRCLDLVHPRLIRVRMGMTKADYEYL